MNIWLGLTVVAGLTLVSTCIVAALRLETPRLIPIAIIRALVQLGILTFLLSGVLANPGLVALFLSVMVVAAALVIRQRLQLGKTRTAQMIVVIMGSVAGPSAVIFGTGALPFEPRYLLALTGITVGSVMTVATLMGRGILANLEARQPEVEGWLALGAHPRQAARLPVRMAASSALVPSIDQTRATGLVTLPGAFVGAVFAGASLQDAAIFQLLVLASILCAATTCVLVLDRLLGAPKKLPRPV